MRRLARLLGLLGLLVPARASADVAFIDSAGISVGASRFSGRSFTGTAVADDGRRLTVPVIDGGQVSSPLTTQVETTIGVRVDRLYLAGWIAIGGGRTAHGAGVRDGDAVWIRTGGVAVGGGGGEAGARLHLRPALDLWLGARVGFELVNLDVQRIGAWSIAADRAQSFVPFVGPTAALQLHDAWQGVALFTAADALHPGTFRAGLRWQLEL